VQNHNYRSKTNEQQSGSSVRLGHSEKGGYRFEEGVERNRWPSAPAGTHFTPVSLKRISCDGQTDGVVFPEDEQIPD